MADDTPQPLLPTGAVAPGVPASPGPLQVGAITAVPMPTVPPIPLAPEPKSTTNPSTEPKPDEEKDSIRELLETVVFVVVLVLMLKTFLAEAFVIPTGSMATTLLGYHHKVPCRQCGYPLLVNASSEADPQDRVKVDVHRNECENCRFENAPLR